MAHFGISKIQILATRQWRVIRTFKSLPACPGMKAYQDDSNNNPRSIKIRQASLFPKQPYIKKTNLFLARGNFVRGQIVNLFMTKTLVGCCWIRLDELIVIYKLQPWFMQWCDHSGFEKKAAKSIGERALTLMCRPLNRCGTVVSAEGTCCHGRAGNGRSWNCYRGWWRNAWLSGSSNSSPSSVPVCRRGRRHRIGDTHGRTITTAARFASLVELQKHQVYMFTGHSY